MASPADVRRRILRLQFRQGSLKAAQIVGNRAVVWHGQAIGNGQIMAKTGRLWISKKHVPDPHQAHNRGFSSIVYLRRPTFGSRGIWPVPPLFLKGLFRKWRLDRFYGFDRASRTDFLGVRRLATAFVTPGCYQESRALIESGQLAARAIPPGPSTVHRADLHGTEPPRTKHKPASCPVAPCVRF